MLPLELYNEGISNRPWGCCRGVALSKTCDRSRRIRHTVTFALLHRLGRNCDRCIWQAGYNVELTLHKYVCFSLIDHDDSERDRCTYRIHYAFFSIWSSWYNVHSHADLTLCLKWGRALRFSAYRTHARQSRTSGDPWCVSCQGSSTTLARRVTKNSYKYRRIAIIDSEITSIWALKAVKTKTGQAVSQSCKKNLLTSLSTNK